MDVNAALRSNVEACQGPEKANSAGLDIRHSDCALHRKAARVSLFRRLDDKVSKIRPLVEIS